MRFTPCHGNGRFLTVIGTLLFVATISNRPVDAQTEGLELLPPVDSEQSADLTPEAVIGDAPPIYPSEPSWVRPNTWFDSPIWDFAVELGINGSEGNGQTLSLLTSANAKRETEASTVGLDLTYGKTQANGVETQHYALFNSRWDWNISPTWFLYNKNALEYDEFKAFDLRLTLSGGLGYYFIKCEPLIFKGRFGAGTSREFGGPDDDWIPEANFGLDYEHQLTARQKLKATSDYYPSWQDFGDYRLVTSVGWEVRLDEASKLSLKIGAIDRFDSTPNGLKRNDIDYFLTLSWKL